MLVDEAPNLVLHAKRVDNPVEPHSLVFDDRFSDQWNRSVMLGKTILLVPTLIALLVVKEIWFVLARQGKTVVHGNRKRRFSRDFCPWCA